MAGSGKTGVRKKGGGEKPVAIVMGSDSDWQIMKEAASALEELGVSFHKQILSAHRTPDDMAAFAHGARTAGFRVIIAGAGGAAHLPGMIAAITELPVIGVPVPSRQMEGIDALYSIVQMPKGVPVACVAIGGAYNAGLLAAQIIGTDDLLDSMRAFKDTLAANSRAKKLPD